MVRLFALMAAALLASAAPSGLARADDPAKVMGDLLEQLSQRQSEPLAAVLAELRQECEQGDNEEEACAITALRPYLLQQLPVPAK